MNKIIYLPFENLPQRYTKMWNDAIIDALQETESIVVDCDSKEQKISSGEFLDTYRTVAFKFKELIKVSELFRKGEVKNGDVFFIPDTWFFGMSAIKYMAELNGLNVKIATFNHAGRADKDDFVQNLSSWADMQEQAWTDLCDIMFVGSRYHEMRVVEKFHPKKTLVTGAVWSKKWMDKFTKDLNREKKDYIIFPHRICKEKQFDFFIEVAKKNPKLNFVVTTGGDNRLNQVLPKNVRYVYNLTKKEYFQIFANAMGYLSTAKQETFGYTLQEAIYFDCQVVVPDYACYSEYAHKSSIVSFKDMLKDGYLTNKYKNENLRQSKIVSDNAEKIIKELQKL